MQFRPGLRFLLRLMQVADGQEAVGVAVLVLGDEYPGGAEVVV